ncbi:MAG: ankyrin repeat domain-containing protein [Acutalibacteraceae bacterium]
MIEKIFSVLWVWFLLLFYGFNPFVSYSDADEKMHASLYTSGGNYQGVVEAIAEGVDLEYTPYRDRTEFSNEDHLPLSIAAKYGHNRGNWDITQLLLDSGASPNAIGDTGQTLLIYAIGRDEPFYKQLLDAGADVNLCGEGDYAQISPPDVLLGENSLDDDVCLKRLKELLDCGAVIDAQTLGEALLSNGYCHYQTLRYAYSALPDIEKAGMEDTFLQAILSGDEAAIKAAAEGETDVQRQLRACRYTAAFGSVDTLSFLLRQYDSWGMWMADENGATLLHLAARYNDAEMVEWLQTEFPDMKPTLTEEENVFVCAIRNPQSVPILETLYSDADKAMLESLYVYHMIGTYANKDALDFVQKHCDISDDQIYHLMRSAIRNNQTAFLEELFARFPAFDPNFAHPTNVLNREYSEQIEVGDDWPLLWVASNDAQISADMVSILLKHGANVNGTGIYIPAYDAVLARNTQAVRLLLEYGCATAYSGTVEGEETTTLLIQAVQVGSLDIVNLLLEQHQDGGMYEQALETAERCFSDDILQALKAYGES